MVASMWRFGRRTRTLFPSLVLLTAVLALGWTFSDVPPSHRNYEAVSSLAQAGVVNGYEDGTFRPDEPVLRAQFAKMVVNLLGLPVSEADVSPFLDVEKPSDSLYPDNYIGVAAREGITKGLTATSFGPYQKLTRAQSITMLVRAADTYHPGVLDEPHPGWRGQVEAGDPTHGVNIRRAEYAGLLAGLDLARFTPSESATRAEVAQIMANLKGKYTPLNVRDFGAKGDGSTNDRAAVQMALDAASKSRTPLYFPPGRYKIGFSKSASHLDYEGDVTVLGAGRGATILDVHPKTVDDFEFVLLMSKEPDSHLSLAHLTIEGPSGFKGSYPDTQKESLALSAAPSSPYGHDNRIIVDDVAITGKFYRGISMSGGGGIVQVRGSAITATLVAVQSYESTGTFLDRQVVIEDSVLESGIPASKTSDGAPHGIIVYVHPHVALRVTDTVFKNNPRGAVKQYGEGDNVLGKAPLYSVYENVTFENCDGYTIITPGEAVTTTIRGYKADSGMIGIRNDTVISDSTFVNAGITEAAGHDQPFKNVTITGSAFTLARRDFAAVRSKPGWNLIVIGSKFLFEEGANGGTVGYLGGEENGSRAERAEFRDSDFETRTTRNHPDSAIAFSANDRDDRFAVAGSRFVGPFSQPIAVDSPTEAEIVLTDNQFLP